MSKNINSMSFASLLAGYATAKSAPPKSAPVKSEAPKHPLFDRLAAIRNTPQRILTHAGEDNSSGRVVNLGVLFIIIDDFPNEVLWRLWLQQGGAEPLSNTTLHHDVHAASVSETNNTAGEQQPYAENNGNSAPNTVQIWFHAKNSEKVRSAWVRERLVKSFHFKPEWGSVEITKVMAHLLNEATHDAPHINKFCFASESCIPIVPLAEVLQRLYSPVRGHSASSTKPSTNTSNSSNREIGASSSEVSMPADSVLPSTECGAKAAVLHTLEADQSLCLDYDSSWLSYTDTANNGYAHQLQFEPLKRALPAECIYKASQWLMVSRTHALAVLNVLQQLHDSPNTQDREPQNQPRLLQDNSRLTAVPALCERIFSIFKDVRASDEMFFPCLLALLGFLPGAAIADKGTVVTNGTAATTHTTKDTAMATAVAARVLCQQVTYSDWTHSAKNPADYKDTFPSSLAQALRTAHTQLTTGKGSAGSTNKRRSSQEQEININADQHSVVFLRKVKFSVRISSIGTINNGTSVSTGAALIESRDKFLRSWLPFIICPENIPGAVHGAADANAVDAKLLDEWLQRAAVLLQQISSTAVVPAPAATGIHSDRSASHSGTQGASNRESTDHRDSGNSGVSRVDKYNVGDGRSTYSDYRSSDDRYKRDRDQSDYAHDNKRYRY